MDTSKLKKPIDDSKKWVILFYNGTFAPIHDGHVSVITTAKNYLENNLNFEVLGAYLSPSSGNYCRSKLENESIIPKYRVEMCNLVAEQIDWLMVDTWEMMHCFQFVDIEMSSLYSRLLKYCDFLKDREFYMCWVCGIDSYSLTSFDTIPEQYCLTLCVKNRDGFEENLKFLDQLKRSNPYGHNIMVVEIPTKNISSTIIRHKLQSNGSIDKYFKSCPKVAEYLKTHNIWYQERKYKSIEIYDTEISLNKVMNESDETLLTSMLQVANIINDKTSVIEYDSCRLGLFKDIKQNLLLIRNIVYSTDEVISPLKFVLKQCGNGEGYHNNLEPLFYSKLFNDDPILIKCHAIIRKKHHQNEHYFIIMDYIESSSCLDYSIGISSAFVYAIIKEITRFHLIYYKIDLSKYNLPSICDKNGQQWMKSYLVHTEQLLENIFKSRYAIDETSEVIRFLENRFIESIDKLTKSNFHSLCHNNLCIFNILFSNELISQLNKLNVKSIEEIEYEIGQNEFRDIKIFDFEYASIGCPLVDIVFLLYTSVESEFLRSHEMHILNYYYAMICYYGVVDYSIYQCIDDYNTAKYFLLPRIVAKLGYSLNAQNNLDFLLQSLINDYYAKTRKDSLFEIFN